jgi:hypothetical protein
VVSVKGSGFAALDHVKICFHDPVNGTMLLAKTLSGADGSLVASVTIPGNAVPGAQPLRASAARSGQRAVTTFTVT